MSNPKQAPEKKQYIVTFENIASKVRKRKCLDADNFTDLSGQVVFYETANYCNAVAVEMISDE